MSRLSSRIDLPSWGLFVVSLALRLAHLATVSDSPLFRNLFIDPAMYDEWGRRVASGRLLFDAPFFLDPLYPYFVGAVYAVAGPHPMAVALVQALLDALVPVIVYRACRRWLGPTVALVAGSIAAVHAMSIYWVGILMKPTLSVFLAAVALGLLSRALAEGGWARWVGAGAALALAGLTRGQALLVIPVLAVWLLFAASRWTPGPTLAVRAREVGALLAGAVCILVLPAAHNLAVSGEFIPTTANWGVIFYLGNNAGNPDGEFQQLAFVDPHPQFEQRDFKREAERESGRSLTHREAGRFWFARAAAWIVRHPVDWLVVSARKLRTLWEPYETPASLDYYLYREWAPVLQLPLPGFGLLAPFALLGGALSWRSRGWPRLLAVFVAAYTLSVVAFFVLTRFRMLAMPALFVLAAVGAVELVRAFADVAQGGRVRRAVVLVVALVALAVIVHFPVRAKMDSPAYRVAAALGIPTRPETKALARLNLGVTLAALAKNAEDPEELLEEAEDQLRMAADEQSERDGLGPGEDYAARIHVELAKVLARQQRDREAIEEFRLAATYDPSDFRIYHGLGLLYRRIGDPEAAAEAFREALAREPRYVESAVQLGEVLLELGRPAEAELAFRHALTLRPSHPRALAGLERARRAGP